MTLAELRKKSGLTQADLAKKLGIAKRTFEYWESGECEPSALDVIALADYLGRDPLTILRAIVATKQTPKHPRRRGRPSSNTNADAAPNNRCG